MLYRLARLLAPPLCIVCGMEGYQLCRACADRLPPASQGCHRCRRNNITGQTCIECRPFSGLDGLISAGRYETVLRELILGLKFNQQRAAIGPLSELMATQVTQAFSAKVPFQVVASIPTAASRQRRRGFDHAGLLGRGVAAKLELPYQTLLHRRSNMRQLGQSRQQRLRQASGLFAATRSVTGTVILVDDVTTTGATLNAGAAALLSAGAEQVWAVVVATDM